MADSLDKFEVVSKIGHGSFGIIRKVKRKTDGFIMCRKEISYLKMSQKEREQLHAEFQILSGLKHPNIVAYYHREHLKSSQDLHLYMEYCGNGDLGRVIKDLAHKNQNAEEMFVWSIFSQLVSALYRCHYGVDPPDVGRNVLGNVAAPRPKVPGGAVTILHRDLKPENVFLGEDNSVKLGDFGLSKMIQCTDFASTYVGTPFYMSPEICAAEKYTLKSDIWSLGCIMYELCTKQPPFNARSHYQLVQKIKEGKIAPLPRVYSDELFSVIKDCLRVNPDQRPDTATLLHLPVVRLMRKEKEVVEVSKMLELKAEALDKKVQETNHKMEAERAYLRQETDNQVRREWEVKARLEIDRLVNEEIESLQRRFEAEVQARVQDEVHKKAASLPPPAAESNKDLGSSLSKSDFPQSIGTASTDCDYSSCGTDLTELSIDSPEPAPLKKTARTPFSRAQTMGAHAGTPMDIEMASPSPIAIASLSLSPRRNQVTKAPSANQPTIFEGEEDADSDARWRSADPEIPESDDDDEPMMPSPTRQKSNRNPFGPKRPVLPTTKTAPVNRLKTQASLGLTKGNIPQPAASAPDLRPQTGNGPLRERGNSPNRRLSKIPSATNIGGLSGGENGLVSKKKPQSQPQSQLQEPPTLNHIGPKNNNVQGRTLIELQQARAGGRPVDANPNVSPKRNTKTIQRPGSGYSEVAVWDPERDEMPSPFLVRRKQIARV